MFFCFKNSIYLYLIAILLGLDLVFMQNNRDCPENFTLNPQYPATEPECFPDDFVFYSSVNLAYYFFNLVTINDVNISEEDWVGAFNGDVCVGARQWDMGDSESYDVPVFGDDGTNFTDGYMTSQPGNNVPSFKIYDTSENIYIDAISSENIEWSLLDAPFIELLYSYAAIQGCMDQYACNYTPYATEDDGSCEYCSCNLNPLIINSWETTTGPSGNEGYVFNIMIFSNESSGEILTFKYYNDLSDYVICLSETLEFETDMIIGNALDAYNFNIPSDWLDADLLLPESFIINSAYPNPFNPYVNIEYSIIEPSNIDFYFYSLSGKLIDEINAGFLSKGEYSISWEPENKASGIYFVVISNGIEKNMTKITLLK